MISCHILGTGVAAPGLANWGIARPILAGKSPYVATPLPRLNPTRLPANERRRANTAIRLALEVAEQVVQATDIDPAKTATVFASSGGDSNVIHAICQALCSPSPTLSPTAFHNSVHNAPAGYWSIATTSILPYTTLSALDGSIAMGLLEAVTQLLSGEGPILLVGYEVPIPFPLNEQRPAHNPFACALALSHHCSSSCQGHLEIAYDDEGQETLLDDPALEVLRRDNATARVLPLLKLLASRCTGDVFLPLHQQRRLRLHFTPC